MKTNVRSLSVLILCQNISSQVYFRLSFSTEHSVGLTGRGNVDSNNDNPSPSASARSNDAHNYDGAYKTDHHCCGDDDDADSRNGKKMEGEISSVPPRPSHPSPSPKIHLHSCAGDLFVESHIITHNP